MRDEVNLNTIMLGPEGSGKTVLAAVLADFVGKNPKLGLKIRSATFDTKKYFEDVMSVMRRGDWPPSTRQGEPQALDWQWGAFGEWYPAGLQDPAGQDIREELTGKSSALGMLERIQQANLLILVVDVVSHQSANDSQRQQNGWIVEKILQLFNPECASIIIVATKADRFIHELSGDRFGNREAVLATIANRLPEANLEQYREVLNHPRCAAVAVAAVEAVSEYTSDGQILRPAHDLNSLGMPGLVDKIVAAIGFERQRVMDEERVADGEDERRRRRQLLAVAAQWGLPAVAVISVVAWLWLRPPSPPPPPQVRKTCTACDGKGQVLIDNTWPVRDEFVKCLPCDGKGEKTVPAY